MLEKAKKIIIATLSSARPNTWLRVWGEMIVAAVLASYPHFNFFSFIKAFIATSPLLWTAAYMLNDLTDIRLDQQHLVRRERPLTLGIVKKNQAIIIMTALTLFSLCLGLTLSWVFFFLLILLATSQLLYTLPSARLKEKFFWDIFLNGVNSVLRYLLGWYSQRVINPFYLYPLLMFAFIKMALFIGHRLQNRELEIKNGIKSTITILSVNKLRLVTIILLLAVIYSYLYCLLLGIFPINSLIAIPVGILIFLFFRKNISLKQFFTQERNLTLRNFLYLEYFFMANIIALTILLP